MLRNVDSPRAMPFTLAAESKTGLASAGLLSALSRGYAATSPNLGRGDRESALLEQCDYIWSMNSRVRLTTSSLMPMWPIFS